MMLTVLQVAELYGVTEHTVLSWINSGDLKAIDVSRAGSQPRWRIRKAALDAFEALRSGDPPAKQLPRRHRDGEIIDFIK